YKYSGDTVAWTNGTGNNVDSGDVVVLGFRSLGIATVDIASTGTGSVATCGVFELTKATHDTTAAIAAGAHVWWDATGEKCYNAPAAGYYYIGVAAEAAASTADTVRVKLGRFSDDPGVRQVTAAAAENTALKAADFLTGSTTV